MATTPVATTPSDDRSLFKAHINKRTPCHCTTNGKECKGLLERYYNDPSAPYPDNKRQVIFKINNPSKAKSQKVKENAMKQQVYNRAAELLKVANPSDKKHIHIGIVHYPREVIQHYNNNVSGSKGNFTEYLLPSSVVSMSQLGVEFTKGKDGFNCIGTTQEDPACKRNSKCKCNRFVNAPFITKSGANLAMRDMNSARGRRVDTFSDSRINTLAPQEAVIQSHRAERLQDESDKSKQKADDIQEKLDDVRKELDYEKAKYNPAQNNTVLLQQIANLRQENTQLKRERDVAFTERDNALAQLEPKKKKLKTLHQQSRRKAKSPANTPNDDGTTSAYDLAQMGICRRSILDSAWHAHWKVASRSLLNFHSLNECLVYISLLFPGLAKEVKKLQDVGAKEYVTGKRLSPLEQCILCRVLPKMGIDDKQIGFMWGIGESGVSKIKKCWFPQWGYAGKILTDLDLYLDYVDMERPDDYYENLLDLVGSQCDGKDFLCHSFRRSSALNRAQRSSKMKASALRCITWSSCTGLVWAFTPLILSRVTENGLVHWYGSNESKDDMYVPIKRSDWSTSDDANNSTDVEESEVVVGGGNGPWNIEMSTSLFDSDADEVDEPDCFTGNNDDEELYAEEEEEEECVLHECEIDLSDGEGSDSDVDNTLDDDGCLDLEAEIDNFNKELSTEDDDKKLVSKDLLRLEELKEAAKEVLNSGPDRNGKAKLEQLQMLEVLHQTYESGDLKKCLLSMYLKLTEHHRTRLIKELEMFRDGELDTPPQIPRRLAKLPQLYKVLADRGFDGDSLSYPHFNIIITPEFLGSKRDQFSMAELERDRRICELRYTCEVVFSRVTTEKYVSDVIPYSRLAHIEHAHCWAHAQANLRQPLKMPGKKSGINESYFK